MIAVWILIVVTHVNAGAVVTFQEFNTQSACTVAQGAVYAGVKENGYGVYAQCVPKG